MSILFIVYEMAKMYAKLEDEFRAICNNPIEPYQGSKIDCSNLSKQHATCLKNKLTRKKKARKTYGRNKHN